MYVRKYLMLSDILIMRKLIITSYLVLMFSLSSFAQENYFDYHKKITEAESAILDSNYTKASIIYYDLFKNYDFIFLANCVTACQTAIVTKNDTLAFHFLERAVKQGLKLNSIKTNRSLKHLLDKVQWSIFEAKYDSLRTIYLSSINWGLREEINKLFEQDRKWRDRHETRPWNFIWKPIIKIKWNYVLKGIVEEELVPLIHSYGYPGERLIGVDEKYMNTKFRDDHFNSFMVRLILIHYFSKPRKFNDSVFISEIEKGNLHPKHYAELYDFIAAYSKNKSPLKNQFFCQWHYGEISLKKTTVEKVNKRRKNIGLGSYEDRLRELQNWIQKEEADKPYVKIYY